MGFSANATAIRELEAQVDNIENVIQDLRNQQRSLRTQHNSNLPFFCLPLEICITILSFACHKGRLPEKNRYSEKIPLITTPFVISAVCHGWRVMARSTPGLWSSVSLCVRPYIKNRSEVQAELLKQWLQLAGAFPLSIVMTFDQREVMENSEALVEGEAGFDGQSEECLATLAVVTSVATSRSHQWESLDLFLPFYWAKIFESGIGHCPNLKSLDLHIDTEGEDPYQWSTPPFSATFRDAPKLRTVTIGHENVELPHHQLEELTFWGYAPSEAFFSKCNNLKIYRAHRSKLWVKPDTSHPVHLSKLVSLDVMFLEPQLLLQYLVTPSLVSITIALNGREEVEAFLAFLTRSGATLERLSIIDHVPGEELLCKIFDALPNLSHLEIDEPVLDDQYCDPGCQNRMWHPSRRFFNYFSTPNTTSGGLPLPHLTSVRFRCPLKFPTIMDVDSGTLALMLTPWKRRS